MKVPIQTLAQARNVEAQVRALREQFEAEERSASNTSSFDEFSQDTIRIQRETDEAAQEPLHKVLGLLTKMEERMGAVETRLASPETPADPETASADAKAKALVEADLAAKGIDLNSGNDSEAIAKLAKLYEQQQREIQKLNESKTARTGLPGYDGTSEAEGEDKFDLVRAVAGSLNNWTGAYAKSTERKLLDEYHSHLRALGVSVSSAGGFLVAPTWMSDLIELLRPNTVAIQLGMDVMPNLTGGPHVWPSIKGGASAFWVAEGKDATRSQLTTGSLELRPRPLVAMTALSEDILDDAPGVSPRVNQDLADAMAEAIDRGVMLGGGGVGEPLGIVNSPGIGTTDWSGATFPTGVNYGVNAVQLFQNISDLLDDMVFQVAARNAYKGKLGFAISPLGALKLRSAKNHSGDPMFFDAKSTDPNVTSSVGLAAGSLWGHNWGMSTQLAYGAVTDFIFGNWADLIMGRWGVTKVDASKSASDGTVSAFMKRQVWVRMSSRVDTGLRHGESFQIANGWAN